MCTLELSRFYMIFSNKIYVKIILTLTNEYKEHFLLFLCSTLILFLSKNIFYKLHIYLKMFFSNTY